MINIHGIKNIHGIQELDEVEILKTGERAIVVWADDDPAHDSYLLDIKGKNEMPDFYSRKDFKLIGR
ncbi:hypothetical protein [Acidaminococcus timonensis]|jgi:hypothetical protein|uniref:hypothetical protein n=1 Tax=Acidaminococcus timonensis TaxID=1871002 RepID=UPI0015B67608|nr:hypothetical protein [Acidaminococcus timonensis]